MQLAENLVSNTDNVTSDVAVPPEVIEAATRGGLYELGESYIRGEWETNDLFQLLFQLVTGDTRIPVTFRKFSPRVIGSLIKDRVMNLQVGKRAFEVGEKHYDLGNDLFSKMLDASSMSYTCGYWRNARNLDEAQMNKIDLLCKKLKLKPGMRVSKEQAAFARERCQGLPVEILIQDYQTFSGSFDCVVSIEMIEAVGRKNIPTFFAMVERCLKERGLFALQVISAETFSLRSNAGLDQFIMWLQRRIFPNGWIPSFPSIIDPARGNLVVEDLHNFSADYATTLRAWALNFEAAWPSLRAKYGDEFRRMWLYYLQGCEALFTARMVQLYQVVYSKGGIPGGYEAVR